jgi:hypothetical protein
MTSCYLITNTLKTMCVAVGFTLADIKDSARRVLTIEAKRAPALRETFVVYHYTVDGDLVKMGTCEGVLHGTI